MRRGIERAHDDVVVVRAAATTPSASGFVLSRRLTTGSVPKAATGTASHAASGWPAGSTASSRSLHTGTISPGSSLGSETKPMSTVPLRT